MGRGAGRVVLLALALLLVVRATPASAAPKSYLVMASQRPASWSALLTPITSQFRIFYIFDSINGIALRIDNVFVSALKLFGRYTYTVLPGVAVIEDKLYEVRTTHSWGFLGLEGLDGEPIDVWKNDVDFGEGVIIANVDTGVSPISASFRDDGSLPKPDRWRGGCQQGYSGCNNKLVGARVFNEGIKLLSKQLNETEVNSPWDHDGHGTHTLSTAGGAFVPNAGAFGRGTGTAKGGSPRAHVASYKACFTTGCSSLDILMAILTAVEDGVHVLSLSVGSPASDYVADTIAIGTAYAVTQSVVVVAAGGNDGPAAGSISNVAPWMLTVGASTMDRLFPADVIIGTKTIKGQSLSNSTSQPCVMISGEKANAAGQSAANSALCLPGSLDPAKVSGKIVVCTRGGSNGRVAKGQVVKDAGGVGMVLCNDAASGDNVIADPHIIPAAHCSYSKCLEILSYIQSTGSPVGEIKTKDEEVGVEPSPVMAAFSSRGPNTITPQILKPDIIAPGVSVIAAYSEEVSPTGLDSDHRRVPYMVESGTSMSCPHVAGIAGLLRKKYPKWNPNMVYSAIMTTATRLANDDAGIRDETGGAATPFSYGSGHVNPVRALDPGLVYDTTIHDYANFICSMRPTDTQGLLPVPLPLGLEELWTLLIRMFRGADSDPFKCSKDNNHPEDLNYPSISAPCLPTSGSFTVKRRVKNVGGGAASYTVRITQPAGVTVTVNPSTLSFDGKNPEEEKHFMVTLKVYNADMAADYVFGGIGWVDGKHYVWSPIVATTKCG
uniref:Subtilisin-like protease n=1 Tax=Hordeum vulgare subsp. vulgare TaxID=112509 RepID=A0A8I6WWD3_HORVV